MAPLALRFLLPSFAALAAATTSAGVQKGSHLDAKDTKDKHKGPTPAALHRVAKKAANFLDSRAHALESADLSALALKLGELPAASEDYVKGYKDMKDLVHSMLQARKSGHKEAEVENFCAEEDKRADRRAKGLVTRKKQLEKTLTSEAKETDSMSKKVAHWDTDVVATQKALTQLTRKRKVEHVRYMKAAAAQKKAEEKLKKHRHGGKIDLSNAAQVQKDTNMADTLLQHSIQMQSAEAVSAIAFTHKQRSDNDRIKVEHESDVDGKHHLKKLRADLMKKAKEYKAVAVDMGRLKTYRAHLAKTCQAKATQHSADEAHRKDEMQAVFGAFKMLEVADL